MSQWKLFGFQFGASDKEANPQRTVRSFAAPDNDDAAKEIAANNLAGAFNYSLDLDKGITNQSALINEYRSTSNIPQVSQAIEDIIAEAVICDEGSPVKLVLDDAPVSDKTKQAFEDAFSKVLNLLRFDVRGNDLFKRWYVDGQINFHILIDEANPREGIQEIRFVDPRNLIKIREYSQRKDATPDYITLRTEEFIEYWIYSESGFQTTPTTVGSNTALTGLKIAKDSIAHCNSGQIDPSSKLILSHLHVAVRIARQLRMLEDSLVIYRVSRASEKRLFYIDLQGLPKGRGEQYMQAIIARYKNKLTYDSNTGEIRDERLHQSIIQDIWLPRRNQNDGTKIETLPGATALGIISDVEYFQQNLYKALFVPISRIDSQNAFIMNSGNNISRDEMKYSRFIDRLRGRFCGLFEELLKTELKLTGVVNETEWQAIRDKVKFDFQRDNHFTELTENQIFMNRLQVYQQMAEAGLIGKYFSEMWVAKNILKMTEEEYEQMKAEIFNELEQNSETEAERLKVKEKFGLIVQDQETGQLVPVAPMAEAEKPESDVVDTLYRKIVEPHLKN